MAPSSPTTTTTRPEATTTVVHRPAPRSRRRRPAHGVNRFVLVCLTPALLLYTVFMLYPTLDVFRMSLYERTGFTGEPTFIGLDNFRALAQDDQFIRAFQNTVLLLVVVTIVTMGMALGLAAIMTREGLRGRNVYRFVLYVPSVLSIVVVAAVFAAIYDQRNGLVNGSLIAAGLDDLTQVWLGDQGLVLYSLAFAMVWQSVGYYLVLYMAAMSGVPKELYEASALDGAGPFRQFFAITLPLIWQNLRTSLTFFILSSINLSFVLVRALTGGGPDGASDVLLSYMYSQAYTNSSYGYGMAIGVVIFTFSFVLALVVNRVTKREALQY